MTPSKTVLKVSDDTAAHAVRFGAEFDRTTGTWFVLGDVPGELQNYVPRRVNQQGPIGEELRSEQRPTGELRERWIQIVQEAARILEGDAKAVRWLNCRKRAFGNKSPIDMMGTIDGCDAVLELLRDAWS